MDDINILPLAFVEQSRKRTFANRYEMHGKRWMDVTLSTLLLVLLTPLLGTVAAMVALSSHGPILLSQPRVGKNEGLFRMLKFRTMRQSLPGDSISDHAKRLAETGVLYKIERDPRVTFIGAVLRKYSLDELPQLINILKGEMSLVGPRPLLPFMVELFPEENRVRTQVRPGLTGLWQVSARSESSSVLQMIYYDEAYQSDISFTNDLRILWRTISVVVRGTGAK